MRASRILTQVGFSISPALAATIPTEAHGHVARDIDEPKGPAGSQPFWMIAHHVLTVDGFEAAVQHGANAIEIDMYASAEKWFADHDGINFLGFETKGDTAETMLKTIADKGDKIGFVWLDMKNPDEFPPCGSSPEGSSASSSSKASSSGPSAGGPPRGSSGNSTSSFSSCETSSITALQKMAREILEPKGVRVLYGFYKDTADNNAWTTINKELNANEAVNLDGNLKYVKKKFERDGPKNIPQRVMSEGLFDAEFDFEKYTPSSIVSEVGRFIRLNFKAMTVWLAGEGTIRNWSNELIRKILNWVGNKEILVSDLTKAVDSQAFGKTFSWTISSNQDSLVNALAKDAQVDGLIYGFPATAYTDHDQTRRAYESIMGWLQNNTETRHLATKEESPW